MTNKFLLQLCNTSNLGGLEVEGAVFFPKQNEAQIQLRQALGCDGSTTLSPIVISSLVSGYSDLINLFGAQRVPAERWLYTQPIWASPNDAIILPAETAGLRRSASEWPLSGELVLDFTNPSTALVSLTGATISDRVAYTEDTEGVISADWPTWSGLTGDIMLGTGESTAVFTHKPTSIDWSSAAERLRNYSSQITRLTSTPFLDYAFYTADTNERRVAVAAAILAKSNESVA